MADASLRQCVSAWAMSATLAAGHAHGGWRVLPHLMSLREPSKGQGGHRKISEGPEVAARAALPDGRSDKHA